MSYPKMCNILYKSIEACPAESTKRSRLGQSVLQGEWRINLSQSVNATGARPMGAPGCPELAFWTASMDNVRKVSMHN